MKRILSIFVAMVILLAFTSPAAASPNTVQVFPSFTILAVVRDQSVTIQTANFPANDSFTVTMGEFGTRGIGGVVVDTTKSGNGGSFQATYDLPASLAGSTRIAIRLHSPTSGFFAFNWFWNNTASVTTPPSPAPSPTPLPTPAPPGFTGFPTFSIVSVVKDQTVTIKGVNFPANDTFEVLMGAFGTRGIDGINVGSTKTGIGGALSATYDIPSGLAGSLRIAIRLQSPTSGFFAFNWFWNNTATVP